MPSLLRRLPAAGRYCRTAGIMDLLLPEIVSAARNKYGELTEAPGSWSPYPGISVAAARRGQQHHDDW